MSWLVTLLMPIALVMAAVRLLITPVYLVIEYNLPSFPPDPYGFTKADRLYWSKIAANYLLNDEGISYLADLRFPKGQQGPPESCQYIDDCTRLYNDRELRHMVDVKAVVKATFRVWYISLGGLLLLWFIAGQARWGREYRQGLRRGGWLTIFILVGIILFVLLSFNVMFVAFHNIFFQAGTWQFLFSDTLIRLFPERFWRDTFIAVGVLAGGFGLLAAYFPRER